METLSNTPTPKPRIVLVHGAFTDSGSWIAVGAQLRSAGYPVIAVANPLRDLATDAGAVASVLAATDGPVVLVGHSYAGTVITQAAAAHDNVIALVYVAAFIPIVEESSGVLNAMFPGSLLVPENLVIRPAADGKTDLSILPSAFGTVYAGGLSDAEIAAGALTQRPITAEALGDELTAVPTRPLPRWQVVATADNAVPTALQRFVAERAGATVLEADSGHSVAAVHPEVVSAAIEAAAQIPATV